MTSRPHILIVSAGLRIGGVERSLLGLLDALSPQKCDVTLFLHSHDGEFMSLLPRWVRLLPPEPPYTDLDRPVISVMRRRPSIALARMAAKAVTAIKAGSFRVHGALLPRSVRYCLPFLPRIPGTYDFAFSFLTPHDIVLHKVNASRKIGWIHTDYSSVETGVDTAFEARAWEPLDTIVAVSDEVARTFGQVFPSLREKICVVENVLSPEFVRHQAAKCDATPEMPPDRGYLRICSVGRFCHQKGFDLAAEACRRLWDLGERVKWFIIGYGPDEALLRERVVKLGIHDSFVILGKRTNPYPYMAACDIYVQPSRYEGKAVTVREAQMLGRPVLITDYPTARSQVQHGVDGFITPMGVDGITEGVRALAADKGLRNRLASNASSRNYGNHLEVEKIYAMCRCET
jgi:glycosyltransferase involved in cell wall biosynthesis